MHFQILNELIMNIFSTFLSKYILNKSWFFQQVRLWAHGSRLVRRIPQVLAKGGEKIRN